MHHIMKHEMVEKLKSLLRRNKSNLQSENRNSHQDDLIEKEIYFPCNAFFRKIIEAVLEQKGISYRDMRLFVIDAEDGAYLRQEEEQYMLQQLYPGLNAYTLCTGRPECHRKEMDYLYEEMGLIVEVLEKKKKAMQKGTGQEEGRLILDFEADGRIREEFLSEKSIYISIYKRNWYQRANLDIEVPIGYNIMIVKGTGFTGCEAVSDRLEREFYAE